ncbi:hypothetical protein CTAYLR_007595 [Chrysophaeum taylorii]|uniref:ABC transporter domain-containing protein n=1 Tax=Chrysophaeum taylorii TaxID=2483200 RepID=A0AAD7U693_9STRA|nr:hypothetical protein CTAYLR_007595 [Chrysophaeum taylorii]
MRGLVGAVFGRAENNARLERADSSGYSLLELEEARVEEERRVAPVKLEVEGMSYWVGSKCIMHEVSCAFIPGEACALMGPSGAGKTTLLNVLSSRASGTVKGRVLVGGREASANAFKAVANYVPQEDDMLTSVTPREQLDYVAELRMGSGVARRSHVDELLRLLRLDACADVRIAGAGGHKGISGGQKKRVSIAMELVNEPSVLFLDEPTSGLDSAMAEEVVASVRRLSKRGLNVVCTIHQPSKGVFLSFDELCLLYKGRLVYHGSPSLALAYLGAARVLSGERRDDDNPAEVALNALATTTDAHALDETWRAAVVGRLEDFFSSQTPPPDVEAAPWHAPGRRDRLAALEAAAKKSSSSSSSSSRYLLSRGFVVDDENEDIVVDGKCETAYPIPKSRQLLVLLRRTCYDHRVVKLRIQLRMAIGLGLLYGLVFYKLENTQNQYDMRLSALFMSVIYNGMMCVSQASMLVPLEKRVLLREYQNGVYALAPYLTAAIFSRFIFQFLATTIWAVPFYLMSGLERRFENFFVFLAAVSALAYIGLIYGFMIGTIAHSPQKAQQLLVPAIMPLLIFCGFLIQYDGVRFYFLELWYASFFRYAFTILVVNEFSRGKFKKCHLSRHHYCPLNSYARKDDGNGNENESANANANDDARSIGGGGVSAISYDRGIKVDRIYVVTKVLDFRTDAVPVYFYVLLAYALAITVAAYYLLKYQARKRYG